MIELQIQVIILIDFCDSDITQISTVHIGYLADLSSTLTESFFKKINRLIIYWPLSITDLSV